MLPIYNSPPSCAGSPNLTIMYQEADLDLAAVDKSGYIIRPYKIRSARLSGVTRTYTTILVQ